MAYHIHIRHPDLYRLLESGRGFLTEAGIAMRDEMRNDTPVWDSGIMQHLWFVETDPKTGAVDLYNTYNTPDSGKPIARHLYEGTAERIYPRFYKALHWTDRYGEHWRASVAGIDPDRIGRYRKGGPIYSFPKRMIGAAYRGLDNYLERWERER